MNPLIVISVILTFIVGFAIGFGTAKFDLLFSTFAKKDDLSQMYAGHNLKKRSVQ